MKIVKSNIIKKLFKFYRFLLVGSYSIDFQHNWYEVKFGGRIISLFIAYLLILMKLIIITLNVKLNTIDEMKIPLFILCVIVYLINNYFCLRIYSQEYIVKLAERYENYYGGMKRKFIYFYCFPWVVFLLLIFFYNLFLISLIIQRFWLWYKSSEGLTPFSKRMDRSCPIPSKLFFSSPSTTLRHRK